jgi:alpha-amylase
MQALNVRYELLWQKPLEKEIRFGTELNLTLLAGHDDGRYYLDGKNERQLMDYAGAISGVRELSLIDEYFKFALKISTDKDMDVWRYPVNTISQSESGFDLLYQGSCIIWSALVPKGAQELAFQIRLEFTDR